METYDEAIKACKSEDKQALLFPPAEGTEIDLTLIDRYLLEQKNPDEETKTSDSIKKIIHAGLELNVLEAGYTQTLFYMAQVYSQKGDIEQGIKYCAQTMTRQMTNKTY